MIVSRTKPVCGKESLFVGVVVRGCNIVRGMTLFFVIQCYLGAALLCTVLEITY